MTSTRFPITAQGLSLVLVLCGLGLAALPPGLFGPSRAAAAESGKQLSSLRFVKKGKLDYFNQEPPRSADELELTLGQGIDGAVFYVRFMSAYGTKRFDALSESQKKRVIAWFHDPKNPLREFACTCYKDPDRAKKDVDAFYGRGSLDDVKPDMIAELDKNKKLVPWKLTGTKGDRVFCYFVKRWLGANVPLFSF